jgi:hypothetical protein
MDTTDNNDDKGASYHIHDNIHGTADNDDDVNVNNNDCTTIDCECDDDDTATSFSDILSSIN